MRQILDNDYGLNEYQLNSQESAIYPNRGNNLHYPLMGLVGEAGEVAEKIKKLWRDKGQIKGDEFSPEDKYALCKELGDVLWYIAALANELDLNLAHVALENIIKLRAREVNNTLKGSGDNR